MKLLFSLLAIALLSMLTSCATQQGYTTTTTTTDTATHSDAVRTAGSGGVSMPSSGPSMMSGGAR